MKYNMKPDLQELENGAKRHKDGGYYVTQL